MEWSTASGFYSLSAISSTYIPETWKKGFDNDIPLKGEHSMQRLLYVLTVVFDDIILLISFL